MKFTIAICTWNRSNLLDQTLESLRHLDVPEKGTWDLLVVNNNCTDDTDAVIEKHEKRLPLRRIFEPQQGLSSARNAAVDNATGDYILWTDDDVLVDPRWLVSYANAVERWPDAVVLGGKVLPWFEARPPKWLDENIAWVSGFYALRDLGDQEMPLPPDSNPYGANICFRTEVLRQYKFDPELGRKGAVLAGGEETELINRIRSIGAQVVWVPESRVRHFLPKSRMTLRYLRRYHFGQGRYQAKPIPKNGAEIWGYPRWLVRKWLAMELSWLLLRVRRPSSLWLKTMADAASIRGQLAAYRARYRAI